jgi:DNA-binding CsgD family transcriptional regulator
MLLFAIQRIAAALEQDDPESADRILGDILGDVLGESPAPAGPMGQPHEVLRLAVLGARAQRARRAAAPRNRRTAEQIGQRLAQLARLVDKVAGDSPAMTAFRLTFQAETAPDGLPVWDRAAAAWRDLGNPYETALTLTDAASSALASNNRPGARTRLHEARTLATQLGAAPLLARIDDIVARGRLAEDTTAAPPNEFGLTPRELVVLHKLAAGLSNPQIADELFISTNTVATHVARILTKLDASTRTEAADKAHRARLLASPDQTRQTSGRPAS